jgi:hypothetical protein
MSTLMLVTRRAKALHLYGTRSDRAPIEWPWVDRQLTEAGTYWVVARTSGQPHPRPVWGIWHDQLLYLSVGGPALLLALRDGSAVTVHLDSGMDVIIVEGTCTHGAPTSPELIESYNRKYDWDYQVSQYGELTQVAPARILAWRSAGWAGRDGFQATGRWDFPGT